MRWIVHVVISVICLWSSGCATAHAEQLQLELLTLTDGRQVQGVLTIVGTDVRVDSYENNRHMGSMILPLARVATRRKLVLFDERHQQHERTDSVQDYAHIDAKAAAIPDGLRLADFITHVRTLTAKDNERARIIFIWICQNISYDLAYLGVVDPYKVYADKTAVCAGFAALYQYMAVACDLRCDIIIGYAKGRSHVYGSSSADANHAWNAVQIDGVWNLIDCTWGAGASFDSAFKRQIKPFYFCPDPATLLPTHLPDDENWQLVAEPIDQDTFEHSLDIRAGYFDNDVHALSHSAADIYTTTGSLRMRFRAPINVRLQAVIKEAGDTGKRLGQQQVLTGHIGMDTIIQTVYPQDGIYMLHILVKKKGDAQHVSAVNYRVHVARDAAHTTIHATAQATQIKHFPLCYEAYYHHRCNLRSPQRQQLSSKKPQTFSIVIPNASSVKIKITDTSDNSTSDASTFHSLKASGSRWSTTRTLSAGTATIYAHFPSDKAGQLRGLVQFQIQ